MPIAVKNGEELSAVVGVSSTVNNEKNIGSVFFYIDDAGQVKDLLETEEIVIRILTGQPVQVRRLVPTTPISTLRLV